MKQQTDRNYVWFRVFLLNIAVFVSLVALVSILGEGYYRFCYDKSDSFALTKNAKRWFNRHYRYNNVDARDNVDYQKIGHSSKRRLVFIGDSFTAGHGVVAVEGRFANLVRNYNKDDFEVLVLAQGGFETGNEIFILNRFLKMGYIHDTVILVYCLNDINDLIAESRSIHEKIRQGTDKEGFLIRHSYFVNTYYYRLRAILDPNISNYYGFVTNAYKSELWEKQKERLRAFASICKVNDIRLLVVTFPFLNAIGDDYEYAAIHKQLGKLWQDLSISHLDLFSIYKNYTPQDLVVGPFDAHPNEFAHKLAAKAVSDFVNKP